MKVTTISLIAAAVVILVLVAVAFIIMSKKKNDEEGTTRGVAKPSLLDILKAKLMLHPRDDISTGPSEIPTEPSKNPTGLFNATAEPSTSNFNWSSFK